MSYRIFLSSSFAFFKIFQRNCWQKSKSPLQDVSCCRLASACRNEVKNVQNLEKDVENYTIGFCWWLNLDICFPQSKEGSPNPNVSTKHRHKTQSTKFSPDGPTSITPCRTWICLWSWCTFSTWEGHSWRLCSAIATSTAFCKVSNQTSQRRSTRVCDFEKNSRTQVNIFFFHTNITRGGTW